MKLTNFWIMPSRAGCKQMIDWWHCWIWIHQKVIIFKGRDFKDWYTIFDIDLRPVKCIEDVNPINTWKIQILFEFESQIWKVW